MSTKPVHRPAEKLAEQGAGKYDPSKTRSRRMPEDPPETGVSESPRVRPARAARLADGGRFADRSPHPFGALARRTRDPRPA
jgi:hypothetical protein